MLLFAKNLPSYSFLQVTNVVNKVLDSLVKMGKINPAAADLDDPAILGKRSQREYIIEELVKTERTYVQHLELLQEFKKLVEEKGIISGDQIHDIFLNLNALLDFQRRFLIRVEQTNAQPTTEQNWGNLFVLYKDAFKVYEPYIANQKRCEQIAQREFEKLRETGGTPEMRQMVESPTVLTSFLLKVSKQPRRCLLAQTTLSPVRSASKPLKSSRPWWKTGKAIASKALASFFFTANSPCSKVTV